MAVGANQHRTIGIDAVSRLPVAVGIAEIASLADGVGHERRPRDFDFLRRPPPRIAFAAGQQHKARAEQVDRRDLLNPVTEPDMSIS